MSCARRGGRSRSGEDGLGDGIGWVGLARRALRRNGLGRAGRGEAALLESAREVRAGSLPCREGRAGRAGERGERSPLESRSCIVRRRPEGPGAAGQQERGVNGSVRPNTRTSSLLVELLLESQNDVVPCPAPYRKFPPIISPCVGSLEVAAQRRDRAALGLARRLLHEC